MLLLSFRAVFEYSRVPSVQTLHLRLLRFTLQAQKKKQGGGLCDWIGLREIWQETIDFPMKIMGLSCKFSLKPTHWLWGYYHTTFNRERQVMQFAKAGDDCEPKSLKAREDGTLDRFGQWCWGRFLPDTMDQPDIHSGRGLHNYMKSPCLMGTSTNCHFR